MKNFSEKSKRVVTRVGAATHGRMQGPSSAAALAEEEQPTGGKEERRKRELNEEEDETSVVAKEPRSRDGT